MIRDGIERNWGSWYEWQLHAREALKRIAPEEYDQLDDQASVIERIPEAVRKRELATAKAEEESRKWKSRYINLDKELEALSQDYYCLQKESDTLENLVREVLFSGLIPKAPDRNWTIRAEKIADWDPQCGCLTNHASYREKYEQRFAHLPKVRKWLGKQPTGMEVENADNHATGIK